MEIKKLSDGSVVHSLGESWIHITEFGNGVVRHTCYGPMSPEFGPVVTDSGREQIARFGRVVFMVDSMSSRVSTEFREHMTGWLKANREIAVAHMIVGSKLIDMAISLVNLFAGKPVILPYSNMQKWEARGRVEAPTFVRLADKPTSMGASV